MKIPLAYSGLRDIDVESVTNVFKSGNSTMGLEVKNLICLAEWYKFDY